MTNIPNDKYIFVIVFIIFPPPIFKGCTYTIEDLSKKYLSTVKVFVPFHFTFKNVAVKGSQFSFPLDIGEAVHLK